MMNSNHIVNGLPQFKVDGMHKTCAACQFRKQARHAFLQEIHVYEKPLEVVQLDGWGIANVASMSGCGFVSLLLMIIRVKYKSILCVSTDKSEVFTNFNSFKAMAKKETCLYHAGNMLEAWWKERILFPMHFQILTKKNGI